MKHTTEELILAATVIDMAQKLRDGSQPAQAAGDELNAWHKDNPVEKFIPDVLHALDCIADNIRRLRSET